MNRKYVIGTSILAIVVFPFIVIEFGVEKAVTLDLPPGRKYEMQKFTSAIPIDDLPAYHSNPGAEHIFYLNYRGGDIQSKFIDHDTVVEDKLYQDVEPFNLDRDFTQFSIEAGTNAPQTWSATLPKPISDQVLIMRTI